MACLCYGYSYIQQEDWKNALVCYKTVFFQSAPLRDAVADEMTRIGNLVKDEEVNHLLSSSTVGLPILKYVQAVDSSTKDDAANRFFAFKLLQQGRLQDAIDYCSLDTNVNASVLRLAAISDGADNKIIAKALALPPLLGIDNTTLIPAVALLAKRNLPYDVYKQSLQEFTGDQSDAFLQFIALTKAGNTTEADKQLNKMTAELKGKTALLGVVLLGSNAPQKWKLYADRLLYIVEKPFRASSVL